MLQASALHTIANYSTLNGRLRDFLLSKISLVRYDMPVGLSHQFPLLKEEEGRGRTINDEPREPKKPRSDEQPIEAEIEKDGLTHIECHCDENNDTPDRLLLFQRLGAVLRGRHLLLLGDVTRCVSFSRGPWRIPDLFTHLKHSFL